MDKAAAAAAAAAVELLCGTDSVSLVGESVFAAEESEPASLLCPAAGPLNEKDSPGVEVGSRIYFEAKHLAEPDSAAAAAVTSVGEADSACVPPEPWTEPGFAGEEQAEKDLKCFGFYTFHLVGS